MSELERKKLINEADIVLTRIENTIYHIVESIKAKKLKKAELGL